MGRPHGPCPVVPDSKARARAVHPWACTSVFLMRGGEFLATIYSWRMRKQKIDQGPLLGQESPGARCSTDDRSSGNRKIFDGQYHVTSVCDRAGCFLRCPSRSAVARRGDAPPRGALEPLGRKRLCAEFHGDSVILRRDALTLTHVLGSNTSVCGRQKAAVAPALRRTASPLGPAPGAAPGKHGALNASII